MDFLDVTDGTPDWYSVEVIDVSFKERIIALQLLPQQKLYNLKSVGPFGS